MDAGELSAEADLDLGGVTGRSDDLGRPGPWVLVEESAARKGVTWAEAGTCVTSTQQGS
jgi:hypothetical protein